MEGNYNTVAASVVNSIGTIWNSWETQWSGTSSTVVVSSPESTSAAASTSVTNPGTNNSSSSPSLETASPAATGVAEFEGGGGHTTGLEHVFGYANVGLDDSPL